MIYVSSSCLKNKYISETVEQLALVGIRYIELSGGTDYYPDLEEDLIKLKKKYDLYYTCHAYFPPPKEPIVVNLASCDDDIYQKSISHYENCIQFMEKLDCKTLSVHAGFLIRIEAGKIGKRLDCAVIYNEEKAYDRFCSAYAYLSNLCQKKGITLYLENNVLSEENYQEFQQHNYLMMTDYDSILMMNKKIDFNLLLDLGHLHVSANTLNLDFCEECNKLKRYVKWLHVSENDGITDQHYPIIRESVISDELGKIYSEGTNITLETIGNIEEIRNSIKYIDRVLK